MQHTIAALYHFAPLPDYKERREELLAVMKDSGIKGSILLAAEGVNGTISGSQEAIETVLAYLRDWPGFALLKARFSLHEAPPFARAKVKLKKELISLGAPADPTKEVGIYVAPQDWNALIASDDVVVVDARNDYEYYLGHFTGARDPHTRKFRQLTDYTHEALDPGKHKKIATYCTGGIRCEKYTAYLRQQGFEEVYHLQGGILRYLEEVPPEQSLWEGDCYVFDERIAVGHGLTPATDVTACPGCGHPLKAEDREHPAYVAGASCAYCATAIPSNMDARPDPQRYARS